VKATIGAKIDSIPFNCFEECRSLKRVNILSSKFTGFKDYSFQGCESLEEIHFVKGVCPTEWNQNAYVGSVFEFGYFDCSKFWDLEPLDNSNNSKGGFPTYGIIVLIVSGAVILVIVVVLLSYFKFIKGKNREFVQELSSIH
jgi:hypothetical protein